MHKFHLNKPIDRSNGQAIHTSRLSIHIAGRPAFSNDALTAFKRLLLPLFVYKKRSAEFSGGQPAISGRWGYCFVFADTAVVVIGNPEALKYVEEILFVYLSVRLSVHTLIRLYAYIYQIESIINVASFSLLFLWVIINYVVMILHGTSMDAMKMNELFCSIKC